jgi:hypothetical protein
MFSSEPPPEPRPVAPPPSGTGAAPGLDREPSHPLVRRLWTALRAEYEGEMNTTLRVAVMLADGLPGERVMVGLGVSPQEFRACLARLERVAEAIHRDDEAAPSMGREGVTS